jgi:nucleotide-binding universal stress UspA family protein
MLSVQTILHPTDFSEHSSAAFLLACSLARDYHARLVVVHVAEFPTVVGAADMLVLPLEADFAALRRKLDELQPVVPKVQMERRLVEGDVVEAILQVAKEISASVIVIGTHGRTGMGRLLMGSVAEQVLRKAPCPVVTVKSVLPQGQLAAEGLGQLESPVHAS